MQSTGPKRVISTCIPCHTRKQKCNRRYPCNNCTRRRRPEECAYNSSLALQLPASALQTDEPQRQSQTPPLDQSTQIQPGSDKALVTTSSDQSSRSSKPTQGDDSLAGLFGYFEDSESNTMALVRMLGTVELRDQHEQSKVISTQISKEIQQHVEKMPDRQIIDFLVQYFVSDVFWMEPLVYPPWFLAVYQRWWGLGQFSNVKDVEFAVLLLRICSYASQFLPSPSHAIDRIRDLASICVNLDARGSLIRVQHMSFWGLQSKCEGNMSAFWEALSNIILVAQRAGIHRNRPAQTLGVHELEKEMRRRVFCSLYLWDSLCSRCLDRAPFLPAGLSPENLPRMHLPPNMDDEDAPDGFSERLIQVRLAEFWRDSYSRQSTGYDPALAEEMYEKFCTDFLPTVAPAFALSPSKKWDERLPTIPLQRQVLHITIFDHLCYNFRPLLLQEATHLQNLPHYKKVLLSSQRRALAVAAMEVLDGVSKLHAMLGGSYTRFAGIIFPTFEAAVLLVSLYKLGDFPGGSENDFSSTLAIDPLRSGKVRVTRDRCYQSVNDALARLRTLAEVSPMADVGARNLARLLSELSTPEEPTRQHERSASIQSSSDAGPWPPTSDSELRVSSGFSFSPQLDETYTDWGKISADFELAIGHTQRDNRLNDSGI